MNRTLARPQPSISSSPSVHRNFSKVCPNNNYWSIWSLPIKLTNVVKAINPNTELNSIVLHVLLLYLSVTSFLLRTQSGNPLFNELLTKQRYA